MILLQDPLIKSKVPSKVFTDIFRVSGGGDVGAYNSQKII